MNGNPITRMVFCLLTNNYEEGVLVGPHYSYHESGKPNGVYNYVDGEANSNFVFYFENGEKSRDGYYIR